MKPPKLFIELQDRLHADQYQSNPTLIFKHISELTGMAPRPSKLKLELKPKVNQKKIKIF